MTKIIAGIDEAGRGPVIGPMVIAGVSVDEKGEKALKELGVKDSKLLSPKKREFFSKKIEKIAKDIMILKVGPCKIDNMRNSGINLNKIELIKFAEIISFLEPDKVYVDSPDVKPKRFSKEISKIVGKGIEIVSEHKADEKYPVVSAASIIAKVTRDAEIEKIKKKYGDVGPGYQSNPITIKWLDDWLKTHKEFPDKVVRKTWQTAKDAMARKNQKSMSSFFSKFKGNK